MGKRLTRRERRLFKKIMEIENPQRKVDEIVQKTQLALEIYEKESQQAKVDKWVEKAKHI